MCEWVDEIGIKNLIKVAKGIEGGQDSDKETYRVVKSTQQKEGESEI